MLKMLNAGMIALLFLAGCGGGSSGSSSPPVSTAPPPQPPPQSSVVGSGVKGPLANAIIMAYQVNQNASGLKGLLLDEGTTDEAAQIRDLTIDADASGLVLLEFTVTSDTRDITTGEPPVLSELRTIVDASRIHQDEVTYATSLSTLALDIAVKNVGSAGLYQGDDDGTVSDSELTNALAIAQNQVKSTLGFGLVDESDLFTAPAMLNEETDTLEEQQAVANLRLASELLVAVSQSLQTELATSGIELELDAVLDVLSSDIGDGVVDGRAPDSSANALDVLANLESTIAQDPASLTIPGTDLTAADIFTIISDETSTTNAQVNTEALEAAPLPIPVPAQTAADSDGDGLDDGTDNCPGDSNVDQADNDQDRIGDLCDGDDDNDTVSDTVDAFPFDPEESVDSDNDGIGNNADPDDDNDGVADEEDSFPTDANESLDTDNDGIGDMADNDDDGDSVPDATDNCPASPNADQLDSDGDGIGDVCDETSPPITVSTEWDNFNWDEANWE